MRVLANVVAFQVGWFACVLGAAAGQPWLGPAIVAAAVAAHLGMARRPGAEAGLIALMGMLGTLLDSVPVAAGWLAYPHGQMVAWFAPVWITALWALFATTLNVSLRWLRGRYWLAGLLGALAGPASYAAGAALGALEVRSAAGALSGLAALWGLALPGAVWLAQRLDGAGGLGEPRSVGCLRRP